MCREPDGVLPGFWAKNFAGKNDGISKNAEEKEEVMDESTYPECGEYQYVGDNLEKVLQVFFSEGEMKCAQCGLPVYWHDGFMDKEDLAT